MKKQTIYFLGILVIGLPILLFLLLYLKKNPLETTLNEIENNNYSGAILVANGEQILRKSGYGFASCDNSLSNDGKTVFSIGSITKMFTAAAIGQLDEAGKLNIDQTLDSYFPDVPPDKALITLRHLLNHTSGLQP